MVNDLTPYEALLAVVEAAGSQSELARQLGISNTAVWKWLQSSKRIPAEYALAASRLYGVPAWALRPDIYPREIMRDLGGHAHFNRAANPKEAA